MIPSYYKKLRTTKTYEVTTKGHSLLYRLCVLGAWTMISGIAIVTIKDPTKAAAFVKIITRIIP